MNQLLKTKPSKYRYVFSLVPRLGFIRSAKKVEIIPDLLHGGGDFNYLPMQNDLNIHIFKPRYQMVSKDHIKCFVASNLVAHHVARGLEIICKAFDYNIFIDCPGGKNYIEDTENAYSMQVEEWIKSISVNDNIIFCQIHSAMNFLKFITLFEVFKMDTGILNKLFKSIELRRLHNNLRWEDPLPLYERYLGKDIVETLNNDFPEKFNMCGPYLSMTNVKFKNKSFTLFQLPWGNDLSYLLMKTLLKEKKSIKSISVIGGSAYTGNREIDVDDIFIPDAVSYRGRKMFFNNFALSQHTASSLYEKKIAFGGQVHSVDSSISDNGGGFSLKSLCSRNNYSGFDMEAYGFISAISKNEYPIKVSYLLYVMDKPLENINLGDTYYCKNFLYDLFNSSNRGKNFCYNQIFCGLPSIQD